MDEHKLINLAQKTNNWNAYGWIMRYMQAYDSLQACKREYEGIKLHFERVKEELENKTDNSK